MTVNCEICGDVMYTTQTAQSCTDVDGFCSLCGQDLSCRHTETKIESAYQDNGDRTHKVYDCVICTECETELSRTVSKEAEDCIDENDDDLCDKCDADIYCDHGSGTELIYTTNHDGASRAVTLNCVVCADVIYAITAEEACTATS